MLHFEVQVKQHVRADHPGSVKKPSRYPCFLLVFNDNWNDYGFYTWFALRYFPAEGQDSFLIGELKLMCLGEVDTYDSLEKSFDDNLDSSRYCSLGMDSTYYRNIHDKLKPLGIDVDLLQALCDCTNDVIIYDRFKDSEAFQTSLMRDLRSEKALHDAKFLLSGTRPADAYSFTYQYIPRYDKEVSASWNLHLDYNSPDYLRNVGLIGINGVGKTQMLSQLVEDFLENGTPHFDHTPLFSCCIVIYSSNFDQYNNLNIKKNTRKPYIPCCIEHSSADNTRKKLKRSINSINNGKRMIGDSSLICRYVMMVENYLGTLAEGIFQPVDENKTRYEINDDKFSALIKILSSGQLQILKLITYICENIRMSSLLIIDEPEIHLHPQFILEFMTTLGELLSSFDSFAIIATHSPLVVREIANKQVFLMKRVDGDIPQVAPVNFDTFGEDATILYKNIFGYSENDSYFTRVVTKMLKEKGYNSVVKELEQHMHLSMSARLAIRDIATNLEKGGSV